jgi:hypothetical protein
MRREIAILGLVCVAVAIIILTFFYFLRDSASGHNITVTEISNCQADQYAGAPTIVSRKWSGRTLILEVDERVNCGSPGRLTAASYLVADKLLTVKWTRSDIAGPPTGCTCTSRLRFKLVGLEHKDYEIRLVAD